MDLYTVYLTTGEAKDERMQQVFSLAQAIAPSEKALSILGGDWNFATSAEDRVQSRGLIVSLHRDSTGQKAFNQLMAP